jgi:hypothetical protein
MIPAHHASISSTNNPIDNAMRTVSARAIFFESSWRVRWNSAEPKLKRMATKMAITSHEMMFIAAVYRRPLRLL